MIITKDTPRVIRIGNQSGESYQWDGDLVANEDLIIALNGYFTIKGNLYVNGSVTAACALDVGGDIRVMEFANFSYDVGVEDSIYIGIDMLCSNVIANENIVCGHNLLSSGYIKVQCDIVVGGTLVACKSIAQGFIRVGGQNISTVRSKQQEDAK